MMSIADNAKNDKEVENVFKIPTYAYYITTMYYK